jgi:hypothetical protein
MWNRNRLEWVDDLDRRRNLVDCFWCRLAQPTPGGGGCGGGGRIYMITSQPIGHLSWNRQSDIYRVSHKSFREAISHFIISLYSQIPLYLVANWPSSPQHKLWQASNACFLDLFYNLNSSRSTPTGLVSGRVQERDCYCIPIELGQVDTL